VCCRTGARRRACGSGIDAGGRRPVGRAAASREPRLPVAEADATALPVVDAAVPAVACVLASTDVPDDAAAEREIDRVLRLGGRFVHVAVYPCFTDAFADRSGRPTVVVDERYADRSRSFDAPETGRCPGLGRCAGAAH
jgi:SAM-dependent methyltransferase